MTIDEIKKMMDENGHVGGSLDLEGCTSITALPASIDQSKIIQ